MRLKTHVVLSAMFGGLCLWHSECRSQEIGLPLSGQPVSGASIEGPAVGFVIDGYRPNEMQALTIPSVLDELDVIDAQRAELEILNSTYKERFQEAVNELLKNAGNPEKSKSLSKEIQRIQEEKEAALSKVLLPHQIERIKQVSLQLKVRTLGAARAFSAGLLAEELQITNKQRAKFAEIQKELDESVRLKIAELKEEAQRKIYDELSVQQRERAAILIGDKYSGAAEGIQTRTQLTR